MPSTLIGDGVMSLDFPVPDPQRNYTHCTTAVLVDALVARARSALHFHPTAFLESHDPLARELADRLRTAEAAGDGRGPNDLDPLDIRYTWVSYSTRQLLQFLIVLARERRDMNTLHYLASQEPLAQALADRFTRCERPATTVHADTHSATPAPHTADA